MAATAAAGQPAVEKHRPPKVARIMGGFVVPRLLRSPFHRVASENLLVLRFNDRESGRKLTFPVGRHEIDGQLHVMTVGAWSANFRGGADLEVTMKGRRLPARGTLIDDPDTVASAYRRRIEELGVGPAQGSLSIRINADRVPTLEELREASERIPLTLVRLDIEP